MTNIKRNPLKIRQKQNNKQKQQTNKQKTKKQKKNKKKTQTQTKQEKKKHQVDGSLKSSRTHDNNLQCLENNVIIFNRCGSVKTTSNLF